MAVNGIELSDQALRQVVISGDWTLAEARSRGVLVRRRPDGVLLGFHAEGASPMSLSAVEARHDCAIDWAVVPADWLERGYAALERTHGVLLADGDADEAPGGDGKPGVELALEAIERVGSDVVKLVHGALYDALRLGASDVHFESTGGGIEVKMRLDGILVPAARLRGAERANEIVARLKVLADLDIAERRIPQDGRFRLRTTDRPVDFRLSVMPCAFGEDAVVRLLDKRQLTQAFGDLTLPGLGIDDAIAGPLRRIGRLPHGMVLLTGPTGSGKTTTLYALLNETSTGTEKTVTIEDPIEYQIPGILQIPVNEKKGLTFARGLRSILRHDPDRIMIGEIRDSETAEIAVQSALTGHLVLTTVHANNIFDVLGRFRHMGVDAHNFLAALNGVAAQRLIRLRCRDCALGGPSLAGSRSAAGCPSCRGSGMKGRRAIAELLVLDDELRSMMVDRAPMTDLKAAAAARGVRFLREVAMDLVHRGETTQEEADRVTMAL